MANALTARKQASASPTAVTPGGQEEPIEPVMTKPPKASAIASAQQIESEPVNWRSPVISAAQRVVGMRYLLARGAVTQPLQKLGVGNRLGIAVWSSEFQPKLASTHDAGFNDALFQAGYPGFNLGLSFKVPTLQTNATGGPGYNMRMTSRPRNVKLQKITRATNPPKYYNTTSKPGSF